MSGVQRSIAAGELAGKKCQICMSVILSGDHVIECPGCLLPFHEECWNENRGCASYGCDHAPAAEKKDEAPIQRSSNVWGENKICPSCERSIKAQALKCRFCGADFHTRDSISKSEFESQEYQGEEYTKSRNSLFVLFFLSATGCLSPILLIVTGIMIFGGSALGIEYKRLSAGMRVLVKFIFGMNVFLLATMIILILFDK